LPSHIKEGTFIKFYW